MAIKHNFRVSVHLDLSPEQGLAHIGPHSPFGKQKESWTLARPRGQESSLLVGWGKGATVWPRHGEVPGNQPLMNGVRSPHFSPSPHGPPNQVHHLSALLSPPGTALLVQVLLFADSAAPGSGLSVSCSVCSNGSSKGAAELT